MATSGNDIEYFGSCNRCIDCSYMGDGQLNCQCGHSAYSHIKLSSCRDCECDTFFSPKLKEPSCYNCGHSSDCHNPHGTHCAFEARFITDLILDGVSHAQMLQLWECQFSETISEATLKRRMTQYGIKRTAEYTDESIIEAVMIEQALGTIGYQRLHKALRVKHRMFVSRDRVHDVLKTHQLSRGEDPRLARKLHANPFRSKGPNYLWSLDGHEKLAQPYGLYIYGIIDTFSRRLMAITVMRNKKAETVTRWLIATLRHYQFMPGKIMIDKGSEWTLLKDELGVIQMTSVFNQKIEAFWSQYQKMSDARWYKDCLRELEANGLFCRGSAADKAAVYMVFSGLLQRSLNCFREDYNSHRIRKQRNMELPTGSTPNVMWDQPQLFSVEDYRRQLTGLDIVLPEEEATMTVLSDVTKANCVERYIAVREQN